MGAHLSERQELEEKYHDWKGRRNSCSHYGGEINAAYNFFSNLINAVRNWNVLDFGCGNGWLSIKLGTEGANVWGIDISKVQIDKAKEFADRKNLSGKVHFLRMTGENLSFPDNFFDLIVGISILHHTDLKMALPSIHRVLKCGRRAIFIEALNENIFLRIWRKLTPSRRSVAEQALQYKDLKFIQTIFPDTRYNYFYFFSILWRGLEFLFKKEMMGCFKSFLENIDSVLIKKYPFLGKYCAVVVLELRKEDM